MNRKNNWLTLILTLALGAGAAAAQQNDKEPGLGAPSRTPPDAAKKEEQYGIFIIRTENGFLIVSNRQKNSFSLEFRGADLKPLESDHPVFLLDGRLVQIVVVGRAEYWKPKAGAKTEPTAGELLEAHKTWESDFLAGELGAKLAVMAETFEIERGRRVMFWSFPMPAELGADYSHQLFLTTLLGDEVVALNASPKTPAERAGYRAYLVEAMNTLKVSDTPFDVEKLSRLLKKGQTAE